MNKILFFERNGKKSNSINNFKSLPAKLHSQKKKKTLIRNLEINNTKLDICLYVMNLMNIYFNK